MAAVTKNNPKPATPVGYEFYDTVVLAVDCEAGDLLRFNGSIVNGQPVMVKAATGSKDVDAIALKNYKAGQAGCDVGYVGEMDGYAGLTPGAKLWPSATVAGGIDTSAVNDGAAQMKATRAHRFAFNFLGGFNPA